MTRRELLITAVGGAVALVAEPLKAGAPASTGMSLDQAMLAIGDNFVQRSGWGMKHIVALERVTDWKYGVAGKVATHIELRDGSENSPLMRVGELKRRPMEGLKSKEVFPRAMEQIRGADLVVTDEDRNAKDWRIMTRKEYAQMDPIFKQQEEVANSYKAQLKAAAEKLRSQTTARQDGEALVAGERAREEERKRIAEHPAVKPWTAEEREASPKVLQKINVEQARRDGLEVPDNATYDEVQNAYLARFLGDGYADPRARLIEQSMVEERKRWAAFSA